MKRQRGRGRKPGGNSGNRSLESNGPDVKIRGTAAQIYEKYTQYARDAQSAGDRVRYENLLQHAEHYYRIMAASMPKDKLPGNQDANNNRGDELQRDADGNPHGGEASAEGETTEAVVEVAGGEEASDNSSDGNSEEAAPQRSRRRRPRRRNQDNADKGEASDGGGDTEAKSAMDALARKQAAVAGN